MGLGDFFDGVGDAASSVGKGAVNLGKDLGATVGTVAKGVGWAAKPTHWDDIQHGVSKTVQYGLDHPGQVWDTGFEVGRAMIKEELKPQNIAINAGLLAATLATGGAAAPAFVAKLGMGAKTVKTGVTALKVAETTGEVARGLKAAETGVTALKAVDKTRDVVRGLEAAETAGDTLKAGSRLGRGLDKALGAEPGKLARIMSPIETRAGAGARRARAAEKILEAGGEAPSLLRQAGAAIVQGTGRRAPQQLAGMSDNMYRAQKNLWRVKRAQDMVGQADSVSKGAAIGADPMGAVEDRVAEEINDRVEAMGGGTGYTDPGQTAASPYGKSTYAQSSTSSSAIRTPPAGGAPPPGGLPPVGRGAAFPSPSNPPGAPMGATPTKGYPGMNRGINRGSSSKLPIWAGPRRQALGGIGAQFDWRTVEPLRPNPLVRNQTSRKSDVAQGDLNEQGAPANFSPEMGVSQGQQPFGALNPGQPAMTGPIMRAGEGGRSRHPLTNVRTLNEPVAAVGTGTKAIGAATPSIGMGDVIEATATESKPGVNTMASAVVQPGLGRGPTVYNTSTRAQLRRMGQPTTGMNPAKSFWN